MSRPTQALINLVALKHNVKVTKSLSPQSKIMAVIKANAYGHGLSQIGQALDKEVDALAVACIEEALTLRKAGINLPILLLEYAFDANEISIAAEQNFWLMLTRAETVDTLLSIKVTSPVGVWIKVDTGMHRLGLPPEQLNHTYQRLVACAHIQSDIVLATHFACADELDNTMTLKQLNDFEAICNDIQSANKLASSLANSAAVLGWPETHSNWNRPGYMLYGNLPFAIDDENHQKISSKAKQLKVVMTLQSAIINLREIPIGESVGYGSAWTATRVTKIATIAIGYGDGYPRHAKNGTPVLVNGHRVALIGRVSMDMIMVDVTDLDTVTVGDKAILWGEDLDVNEVAACANTIGYELLAGMPARVPRIYRY
jgi:alanine racemase